jgi:hypothetical protein
LNLVDNINLKRLITDLVNEGGLGLYTKSSMTTNNKSGKSPAASENAENVKVNSNVSSHVAKSKTTPARTPRALVREKILILQCVESTTPGYSNVVYHVGQDGAEGGRIQKSIVFDRQFIQLLDDPTCSRKHFHINFNEKTSQFEICDLGSTSGVLVRIFHNDGYTLNKSDIICFGKHQLIVEDITTINHEKASSSSHSNISGCLTLKCIAPEGSPLENTLYTIESKNGREGTIGRNQNSDISFTVMNQASNKLVGVDGAISSEHARIKCFHHFDHTPSSSSSFSSTIPCITPRSRSEGKEGEDDANPPINNSSSSLKFVLLDGSEHKPSSNGTWLRLSKPNEASRSFPLVEGSEFIIGGSRFKVTYGSTVRAV